MRAALIALGYPTYHFFSLYSSIRDTEMWNLALDAKYFSRGPTFTLVDWDALLGHVAAVTDIPCICFAPELIETYPEAKIVLVDRDIDAWYRSFDKAVIQSGFNPVMDYLAYLDPGFTGAMVWMSKKWRKGFFRSDNNAELRNNAKDVFREHYEMVRKITPKERLLEYKLGSGWEPLCEFLGKDVPDVPFPRVNETEALREKIGIIMRRSMIKGIKKAMWTVGAMAAVGFAYVYLQ